MNFSSNDFKYSRCLSILFYVMYFTFKLMYFFSRWHIACLWLCISLNINRQRRLSMDIIIPFERKNTTTNSKYMNIVDALLVSICFALVTILAFSLSQKSHRIFIISFCPTTLRSCKWLLPSFLVVLTHAFMFYSAASEKKNTVNRIIYFYSNLAPETASNKKWLFFNLNSISPWSRSPLHSPLTLCCPELSVLSVICGSIVHGGP